MDKQQLLRRLDTAWTDLAASYARLSHARMLDAGVTGSWSVRDIIAHVTTWEEEALTHLPAMLEGRRPPRYSVTYGGIDAFNALTTERKRGFSLSEILRQRGDVHRRLVRYVENAPDEQFTRETRFRRRLRLDTYHHYPKHASAIRAWRERLGGE